MEKKNIVFFRIRTIAILIMFIGSMVVLAPQVVQAEEYDGLKPFKNLKAEDLGAHIYFEYSNITYTVDGTGSDYGTASYSSRVSKKVLPDLPAQNTLSVDNIRFGVGTSEKYTNTGNTIKSVALKISSTNETVGSGNEFAFDYSEVRDVGKFDFGSLVDSDTDYNLTLAESFANSVTVKAEYGDLNKTLTEIDDDYSMEDGFFNGDSSDKIPNAGYQTVVVGYENFKEGAISDLKSYMIGNVAGLSAYEEADIRIQEVNLAKAYLTYNMSDSMKTWITDLVDWADNRAKTSSFNNFQYMRGKITSTARLERFFDDFIGGISSGINSISATFGSALDEVSKPVRTWLSDPVGETSKGADTLFNAVGGVLKGAVSAGGDVFGEISTQVGQGTNNLLDGPMGSIGSFFGDISNPLMMLILVIGIVGIIALVVLIYLKQNTTIL